MHFGCHAHVLPAIVSQITHACVQVGRMCLYAPGMNRERKILAAPDCYLTVNEEYDSARRGATHLNTNKIRP